MSLSKSKCWYSNKCLCFFKARCSIMGKITYEPYYNGQGKYLKSGPIPCLGSRVLIHNTSFLRILRKGPIS
jgi:hypothetical protein